MVLGHVQERYRAPAYSATASELRTLDVARCVDPVLGCAACKDSIPRAGSKLDAVLSIVISREA